MLSLNPSLPRCSVNSIGRIRKLRLLAISPVFLAAIINTGYQSILQNDSGVGSTLPMLIGIAVAGLAHVVPVFAMTLLCAVLWERLFSEKRERPFDIGVVYIALVVTLLLPANAGYVHIFFAMSFAMIFAHGIFGGEGRSFLNPALVAVAVMQITFPGGLSGDDQWRDINGYAGTRHLLDYHQQSGLADISWWDAFIGNTQGMMGTTSVLAILLAGIVLVVFRLLSWRLLCAQVLGLLGMGILLNLLGQDLFHLPWYWQPVLGSFAFATVFLASDPSSSACTDAGRWIQGLLAGSLIVLLRALDPSHADNVIPVLLLVSLIAPLIDHIVTWFNIRRRRFGRV